MTFLDHSYNANGFITILFSVSFFEGHWQKMGEVHSHRIIILLLIEFLVYAESNGPPYSCDSSNPLTKSFRFCDAKLPINKRVQDLISRLTLDEKISQLVNTAPAIPRLNISAYQWWSEALHGVSRHGKGIRFNGSIASATMFPQVILTAASFDASLWYRIGQVSQLFEYNI